MPDTTDVGQTPTPAEQLAHLKHAYALLEGVPANRFIMGALIRYIGEGDAQGWPLFGGVADTRERVDVAQILHPDCGCCTSGMLVRVVLEEIGAPPPSHVRFGEFLWNYYGLSESEVNVIIQGNDRPHTHGLTKADYKEGGMNALQGIINLREAALQGVSP